MAISYQTILVAGAELHATLAAERAALPRSTKYPDCYQSEPLCELQTAQARRGILGVELVESVYGWSVRYNSGIQNFGLVASSRCGDVDGTLESAEAFARKWVAQDPERRYAYRRETVCT